MDANLIKSMVAQIALCAGSLVFFSKSIPALAQANTASRDSPAIEPIITEESLPEDAGECNLRTTAVYHADVLEPATALPRTQVFCGFSRRWGGEIEVPMARIDGRYEPGDIGTNVKYTMHEQTSRIPALVLGIEATLPTQRSDPNQNTDERNVEVQPFVAVLKQVRGLTIQGNVGLGIVYGGSEREYRAAYNGALTVPLGNIGFALVGEVNVAFSPLETTLSFSPGLHYSLGKDRYVALALPVSSSNGPARVGAVFQFQMRVRRGRNSE